jgi:rod shape-determining protein MreD
MRLSLLFMAFGGTLAQSSVVPSLAVIGVTPDVPLILTALVAFRRGSEPACLVGFALGLLRDAAGGGLIGIQAATLALAGFAMGHLPGRVWVDLPLVQVPAMLLLTVSEGLLRFALLQLFHFPASLGDVLLHVILPQALYNGFLAAVFLLAVEAAQSLRRWQAWS